MGSRMWVPTVSGPLAAYAAGFESWLLAQGYSPWTVSHRLWQLDLLSRKALRPLALPWPGGES